MRNSKNFPAGAAARARAHSLSIQTPEGVVFTILLAGPVSRCLALAVDFACITTATGICQSLFALTGLISADLAGAFYLIAYFVIFNGYMAFAEWRWRGQTIGKKLLRLRVMEAQGFRIRPSQILVRNLLRFVDALPGFYLVGGAACFLSGRAQRLGDLAANTVVMREPIAPAPDIDQLFAGKFNTLKGFPYLAARLRQKVSPEEARIALQALLRRDSFEPAARAALFDEIAGRLRGHVEFPEDATRGIAAEQYVRDAVEILFG